MAAEDRRVAWLASAAVGLSLVDAAIPSPLPGVKPGLANIVTLVVLARYGWGTAVWVSALRVLAGLRAAVDRFFDEVMVMAEEPLVRQNRLALLGQLAGLMNQVADISRLSA